MPVKGRIRLATVAVRRAKGIDGCEGRIDCAFVEPRKPQKRETFYEEVMNKIRSITAYLGQYCEIILLLHRE